MDFTVLPARPPVYPLTEWTMYLPSQPKLILTLPTGKDVRLSRPIHIRFSRPQSVTHSTTIRAWRWLTSLNPLRRPNRQKLRFADTLLHCRGQGGLSALPSPKPRLLLFSSWIWCKEIVDWFKAERTLSAAGRSVGETNGSHYNIQVPTAPRRVYDMTVRTHNATGEYGYS